MTVLKTAYYESGVGHSAYTTEATFLYFTLRHEFNEPATVIVYLADKDGSITRKYDGNTSSNYVGPGLLQIEKPSGTCIFDGRIIKATHDIGSSRCILVAQDMMSQLDEDRLDYDMREDLGSGLRQSTAASRYAHAGYVGPVYTDIAPDPDLYYLFDVNSNWADDDWNGYYLVFASEMGGDTTIKTGPYTATYSAGFDSETNTEANTWIDDANTHVLADDGGAAATGLTVTYNYRILIENSDFFVANSLTAARLKMTYKLAGHASSSYNEVLIEDTGDVNTYKMGDLEIDGTVRTTTFEVPSTVLDIMAEAADGDVEIKFTVYTNNGAVTTLTIYHAELQVDVETTHDNGAYEILDTDNVNDFLRVDTNLHALLGVNGIGIWEGCPYCVCRSLRYRINALVTGNDPLAAMTTSIETEANGAISTQHFSESTVYEILKELATADKAVFWVTLGGKVLTWKRTFADGVTEWTDASVISWSGGEWDYQPVRNELHIYGTRSGDNQLYINSADLAVDPGATSKTDYLMTRAEVISDSGILSQYDAEEIAKAYVGAKDEVQLYLTAVVAGFSALRLGSQLNINSTLLGLTDEKYTITGFAYDSKKFRTTLQLHPRVSVGYVQRVTFGNAMKETHDKTKKTERRVYNPVLYKQTWSN